MEFIPCYK